MKRYIKTGMLALTMALGLASCSSDVLLGNKEGAQGAGVSGSRVTFSVADGSEKAKTRTAVSVNLAGFAREKAIDASKSYAVVFKPNGDFYKTYQLTYDNGTEKYSFDVEDGGYYYMYVVANTALNLTTETITDAASLFALIETTDPGAAKQASTHFLMISPKTLVDVDGNEDTDLGPVALTRAAVRFDIDVTAIDGFQITRVDVKNRYKTSMLARGNGNATTMTGLTKAPAIETYTVGTGSGEIPASGDYEEGTSTYYLDNQQWLGVIYGYENYSENDADITEMTIYGTLQGVQIEHTVSFKDDSTNPATITKPKRNTIYTVKLTAAGSGLGVGDIHSDIIVKDWTGTETIVYPDLKDTSKPSFQLTSGQTAKDYTALDADAATKTNPGSIIVRKATASTITLTVTGKNIGSTLNCLGHYVKASGETVTATGVTITPGVVTNDGNGNILQTWTIDITDAAMTGSGDYLRFQLANMYNLTTAFRNFDVVTTPKLPIEYVAPYNMASATAFAADNNASSSAYFCWNNSSASSGGVGTVAWTSAKANIQNFIKGTAVSGYHLPSKAEWCSVVAPYYAGSNDSSMGGADGKRIVYKVGQNLNLTEQVAWGVTNNNGTYSYEVEGTFYNDYNCPNDAVHATIGYGLRFKPTASTNGEYTCAYRYEYKDADASVGGGASLTVKVVYVGADQSVTIATISDEAWWTNPDYTLVLPACGYSPYTSPADHNPGYYSSATSPAYGYFWSATPRDASLVWAMHFHPSLVNGNNWGYPGYGFSVRLFADKE